MAYKHWKDMNKDEREEFIRNALEEGHKKEYQAALEWAGKEGPAWEDLTEEQRENVRAENRRHRQEMQAFGEAISRGDLSQ